MKELEIILEKQKYHKIKFRITKTQHLLIKAEINGVKGRFILDTGASNTCVCIKTMELFKLSAKESKTKAVGAGTSDISAQIAKNNTLKIGKWGRNNFNLVVIDLSHVNEVMTQSRTKPVQGILGADILMQGKAIVDYSNHCLYLL